MEQHNIESGSPEDLAKYRLERAKEDVHSAEVLLESGDYRAANETDNQSS